MSIECCDVVCNGRRSGNPEVTVNFDDIYSADLVYVPGCWKLCGDAHCCNFSRYRSKFKFLKSGAQELPLLPGEYEYLQERGWLRQFGEYTHRVINYDFGPSILRIETIISLRPNCVCDHDTRPTICRLYPYFPAFDVGGTLTGRSRGGMFEILEELSGINPACKIGEAPSEEAPKFQAICDAIAQAPRALFYVEAYNLAHRHLRDRLGELKRASAQDYFTVFENNLIRQKLIDHAVLKPGLAKLYQSFVARYGREALEATTYAAV